MIVVDLSLTEIAVRIVEGTVGLERPPGRTAAEALSYLPETDRAGALRAARLIADYVGERAKAAQAAS